MSNIYMATVPIYQTTRYEVHKTHFRDFKKYFDKTDVKKWIIAAEVGKNGYRHYQVRFRSCEELQKIRQNPLFYSSSVDRADNWVDYERKGGKFITSDDTNEILKVRFGKPNNVQRQCLKCLCSQSVREIDVWYDPKGNVGKSWLCNHLYEIGEGYYCPPTIDTVKGLIQFIANGYNNQKYIIIDIPRSWKWSEQLYTAIESIKDGLIYDTRYHSQTRNIRGVKVLVLCNEPPKVSKLSSDRWRINTAFVP